ncbi:MAG: ParB N-terminal domain-containing protein, partial [Pseudonocardia sp.]|nr:ParB N-terminal domain-containing protein [Pseudonocardia sp.]
MTAAAVQDVTEVLAAGVEVGTRVYQVPPGQLVVGANARGDVGEDPEFAASIREHGVLQAISCYVDDGRLVVEMGQRRTVFAARAGLASVPVVVIAPPDEVRRLLEQVTENEHRAPLSTTERAAAVQQLALLGLTAEQLVRRTRLPRVDVDHALAVAASPAAAAAAEVHPLSLVQAAAIAEFDDEPDVVDELLADAASGRFDHTVEYHRERRRGDAEIERVNAELRAAGVQVLDDTARGAAGACVLSSLGLTAEKHARCPGHAAQAMHGGHHVDGRWEHEWFPVYWCTDPVSYG